MAGTAVRIAAVLMIMLACVWLDVCKACPVCSTPVESPPPKIKLPPPPPKKIKLPPPPPKKIKLPPPPPKFKLPPPPMIKLTPPPPMTCPVSLVQMSVCTPILGGILSGTSNSCCALLNMLGVEAEICLCLAIDANILGIPVKSTIDVIATIFIDCGYKVPPNLSCPS